MITVLGRLSPKYYTVNYRLLSEILTKKTKQYTDIF